MLRAILNHLEDWRHDPKRKPLLLRGARQVGKSHIVRDFGRNNFRNLLEINFELNPEFKAIFNESLDPEILIRNIALVSNTPIHAGETLLFFDEIQFCPQAISALRYFYEKAPKFHVIAAGSLIEFALESEQLSMPVGRIQSLFLYPMNFQEFLIAKNEEMFCNFLTEEADISKTISEAVHLKGLALVKEYSVIGGMPEALNSYIKEAETLKYRRIQQELLQTFRDDFGKYARHSKHQYLDKVFLSAPALLSKDYKYSKIDPEIPSRQLKEALLLLEKAGIIKRIKATSGAGLPLEAYADDRRFKLMFLDIGLSQAALGLDPRLALNEDFTAINSGALAEQFVAQELCANSAVYEAKQLYFWARTARNSSAEVDFLYVHGPNILPLEVKSGATGRLKSMRAFIEQYKSPFGIRISSQPLSYKDQVLSIPFYLLPAIDRIVERLTN